MMLFESLEPRHMLSVAPLYYSIDGSGNNLANPTWGSAGSDLLRVAGYAYGDGISSPAGADRPSARVVSNTVGAQPEDIANDRDMSDYIYAFGQFIDHDLDLTPAGTTESDPITVPTGDPDLDPNSTGDQTIDFDRAIVDPTTGTSTSNPRNQPTEVTSFLDGSMVYGSDPSRAAALRTFQGGQLKTSTGDLASLGLLPLNSAGLANENDGPYPSSDLFVAGDVRSNENVELTAIQVLFMREHNRQAGILAQEHPSWNDEQLYQGARQIVIAEIQSITYNEFLPALLGTNAITPYTGYDSSVNPGIAPEFSEAAYRFGHSTVNGGVEFFTNDGGEYEFTYNDPLAGSVTIDSPDEVASGNNGLDFTLAFSNPYPLEQLGPAGTPVIEPDGYTVEDSLLKYLAADNAQEVDTQVEDELRNALFGPPGSGGIDLFAVDIQRGRDLGLPDYNTVRQDYGLSPVTSFDQITSDPTVQAELKQLYGNVNNIDLFVGGLAEDHVAGSSLGPTFQAIISNQFERVRDGDRLWYQNIFSGADLESIQQTTLSDIIRLNSNVTNLQDDAFLFSTGTISGQIFVAASSGGAPAGPGPGGLTVELLDDTGNVLSQTTTAADGTYEFDGLDQGAKFKVQVLAPPSWILKAPAAQAVTLADNSGAGDFTADFNVRFSLIPGSTTLNLTGTGNDVFWVAFLDPTDFVVNLNGQAQTYSTSQIQSVNFSGTGNHEESIVSGQMGKVYAALAPNSGQIYGANITINFSGSAANYVYGNSDSTVSLADSSGANWFVATSTYSYETTPGGYFNFIAGFGSVSAASVAGTTDTAFLYSSAGDTIAETPAYSYLTASGLFAVASGFPVVYAYGSSEGTDQAWLYGSSGNDAFVATPTYSYLSGAVSGLSFFNVAVGFHLTWGISNGGSDMAYLYDSAGDDRFVATNGAAAIKGTNYENIALGFSAVAAFATTGNDVSLIDATQLAPSSSPQQTNPLAFHGSTTTLAATGFKTTKQIATSDDGSFGSTEALDFVLANLN